MYLFVNMPVHLRLEIIHYFGLTTRKPFMPKCAAVSSVFQELCITYTVRSIFSNDSRRQRQILRNSILYNYKTGRHVFNYSSRKVYFFQTSWKHSCWPDTFAGPKWIRRMFIQKSLIALWQRNRIVNCQQINDTDMCIISQEDSANCGQQTLHLIRYRLMLLFHETRIKLALVGFHWNQLY